MRNRKGYNNHVDTLYGVFTWFLFAKKFTGSMCKLPLADLIDKANFESSLLKNHVEIANFQKYTYENMKIHIKHKTNRI